MGSSYILLEDIFHVKDIDEDGKKFVRGTCLRQLSPRERVKCIFPFSTLHFGPQYRLLDYGGICLHLSQSIVSFPCVREVLILLALLLLIFLPQRRAAVRLHKLTEKTDMCYGSVTPPV